MYCKRDQTYKLQWDKSKLKTMWTKQKKLHKDRKHIFRKNVGFVIVICVTNQLIPSY